MVTENDVQNARHEGEAAGFDDAVRNLRAFTGVSYHGRSGLETLAPDLTLPEHVAYFHYQRDLAALERVLAAEAARMEQVVGVTQEQHLAASRDLASHLQERRAARADRSAIVRATGWAKDQAHPLRAKAKSLDQLWERQRDRWWRAMEEHQNVSIELTNVNGWLTTTAEQIADLERQREEDAEAARRDEVSAVRDSSSRWCQVLTRDEFFAQDPQRAARGWGDGQIVAGYDFGDHWRRDGDDINGRGRWFLHWNEDNQEAFFEGRDPLGTIWLLGQGFSGFKEANDFFEPLEGRMKERNSVGIVLDAWAARFGPTG